MRIGRVLAVALALLCVGVVVSAQPRSVVHGAVVEKKSCHKVKRHGRKVRVCRQVKPTPTPSPTPTNTPMPTYTLHGSLEAPECDGGYNIEEANVVVRDENNRIIGTSTTSDDVSPDYNTCLVKFTVSNLPQVQYYQITIGTHGGPTWSFAQLVKDNWTEDLYLG